jgi:hypothetical protein
MRVCYAALFLLMLCDFGYANNLIYPTDNNRDGNVIISTVGPEFRFGTDANPTLTAYRLDSDAEISLDGFLDEAVWQNAPIATGFTQRFPNNGRPASERTEVRVLYTSTALYVGFMAYDSAPDSIMAPLFRRDGNEPSDWVYVTIDSYNDKRTGFAFAVNPRGVQKDVLYFDDSNEDILWDAIWEAKTQILDNGWSAEIRIPMSQLRFSSSTREQEWGINFQRRISRHGEISFWAPTSQTENRLVSQFGRLQGIYDLAKPRRLEIMPYAAGSLLRSPNPGTGSPYYKRNDFSGRIGGDVSYGITSNMTLTATFNPDFGQVEADPSIINLSANENFFAERRPFFLEGSEIFRFGGTRTFSSFGNPNTFYSRRIGRAPQGRPNLAGVNASFIDQPDQTTIASAIKLSGKTNSGWSIGVLNAYTLEETATYTTPAGVEDSFPVEPVSNYFVSRVKKDFNSGNTIVGGFASAVHRRIDGTYFENFLRSSAYLSGVDFEHSFKNREWVTSGVISYSHINGSENAILLAQRSPVRYYQRVDSKKLSLDADRTSLSGYATELSIQKQGGNDPWLGSITYSEVSPGYETNDLGFQGRADYRAINAGIVFRETESKKVQMYETWLFNGTSWNFDNDLTSLGFGNGAFMRFNNLWTLNYEISYNFKQFSDRLARGGPVVQMPESYRFNFNVNTNQNRMISYHAGTFTRFDAAGNYNYNYWGGVTARPTTWLRISYNLEYLSSKSLSQYIVQLQDASATETFGNRYVFGEIGQKTLINNIRVNWTFTPTMSLQTYVRPFIASGSYSNIKELAKPRTYDFNVYGKDVGSISQNANTYTVDPDGTGSANFSVPNPDFNFRSVQGNAVFRWEYRPGSTLFIVWQQQRDDFAQVGDFELNRDLGELFRAKPTNIFLVKVSYWFGR